jgi:hypothetical protein
MESEKMFDQYMSNLMNYVKLNELMQKQFLMNQGNNPGQPQQQFPPQAKNMISGNSININNNYFENNMQEEAQQTRMINQRTNPKIPNNVNAMRNLQMKNPNFNPGLYQ